MLPILILLSARRAAKCEVYLVMTLDPYRRGQQGQGKKVSEKGLYFTILLRFNCVWLSECGTLPIEMSCFALVESWRERVPRYEVALFGIASADHRIKTNCARV